MLRLQVAKDYTSPEEAIEESRRLRQLLVGISGRKTFSGSDGNDFQTQVDELGKYCANEVLNERVCARRDAQIDGNLPRHRHANLAGLPNDDPRWRREIKLHEDIFPNPRKYMASLRSDAERVLSRSRFDSEPHRLISDAPLMELFDEIDLRGVIRRSVIPTDKLLLADARWRATIIARHVRVLDAIIVLLKNTIDGSRGVFAVSYSIAVGLTLVA